MRLRLLAPGASDVQRERGEAAASLFLQRVGISVQEAKEGADARTQWGDSGLAPLLEPTPELIAAAEAWDGAVESALIACYRGQSIPIDADMELVN